MAGKTTFAQGQLKGLVARLRKALADNLTPSLGFVFDVNSFVENRERIGYRLNPAVREVTKGDL